MKLTDPQFTAFKYIKVRTNKFKQTHLVVKEMLQDEKRDIMYYLYYVSLYIAIFLTILFKKEIRV